MAWRVDHSEWVSSAVVRVPVSISSRTWLSPDRPSVAIRAQVKKPKAPKAVVRSTAKYNARAS
jgi:hypothetical protein